jgi:Ca2+-binding EF-hand superfamily protein
MEMAACREQKAIEHLEDGPCASSTASEFLLKVETCKQRKDRIDLLRKNDPDYWSAHCSRSKLRALATAGNLTIRDLLPCYRPECDLRTYAQRQCHSLGGSHGKWCWCSGPTGLSIDGTLTKNMDLSFCSMRNSCQYKGVEHADGAVFQPEHQCGICECLDGTVTCFEDFVPDMQNRLNRTQLNTLSDLVIKFFVFENNRKDNILSDIRKISTLVENIPDDVQIPTLVEWFDHYDKNGNGLIDLNHSEETAFHNHISQFTSCKHFLDHLSEEIDTNDNESITLDEWQSFFSRHTTEPAADDQVVPDASKRSISDGASPRLRRKALENRKKFYYVTL